MYPYSDELFIYVYYHFFALNSLTTFMSLFEFIIHFLTKRCGKKNIAKNLQLKKKVNHTHKTDLCVGLIRGDFCNVGPYKFHSCDLDGCCLR